MAVYWGRDDDTIPIIASLRHYVHKIISANEDTLEFANSVDDRVIVSLTDEERRQLDRVVSCEWTESNNWSPRLTATMILLGSLAQVKGFGFALVSSRKR